MEKTKQEKLIKSEPLLYGLRNFACCIISKDKRIVIWKCLKK